MLPCTGLPRVTQYVIGDLLIITSRLLEDKEGMTFPSLLPPSPPSGLTHHPLRMFTSL